MGRALKTKVRFSQVVPMELRYEAELLVLMLGAGTTETLVEALVVL